MSCGLLPQDCVTDHYCPPLDGRASSPGQWSARCPCCGERKLSLRVGDQARVVWKCHRGCAHADILAALRNVISAACLPRAPGRHRKPGQPPEMKRLADFIVSEKIPPAALRIALLREMGIPPAEARERLGLKKSTYYDAMKILGESGFSD